MQGRDGQDGNGTGRGKHSRVLSCRHEDKMLNFNKLCNFRIGRQ